ncbi:MAG: hypothetical protein ABI877_20495, partial [Gemmatimonadaceae bacterium]
SIVTIDSLPRARPVEAVTAIIDLFRQYEVVAIGEVHRSAEVHRFLTRLVTTPAFRDAVDDIVVEFGNSRYQPLIDRFVSGKDVPTDSLRMVWRNTTQLLVWDSPLYEQFFRLIRSENEKHREGKQLRVLLGDPPIDWDRVNSPEEFPHDFGYRDPDTFRILEAEVLSRNRRALIIIGDMHVIRRDPVSDFRPAAMNRAGLGDALQQKYPGRSLMIWTVQGGGQSGIADSLRGWRAGTMALVTGTSLGAESSWALFGRSITIFRNRDGKRVPVQLVKGDFPAIDAEVDALLYVGPAGRSVDSAASVYADNGYVAELRRRGKILGPVFGIDVDPTLDSLVRLARGRAAR